MVMIVFVIFVTTAAAVGYGRWPGMVPSLALNIVFFQAKPLDIGSWSERARGPQNRGHRMLL